MLLLKSFIISFSDIKFSDNISTIFFISSINCCCCKFLLLISSNVFAVISSEVFKLLVTNKLTGINPITLAITIIDSLVFPCEINIYKYIAIVIEHHVHINLINFTFLHKIIDII